MELASKLDGAGNQLVCTGSPVAVCVSFVEGLPIEIAPDFFDGIFSFVATNSGTGNAVFSVEPYVEAFVSANDTFFTRVDPIAAAVPEPATLALVGIGLAGVGFSRRKLI